MGLIDASGTSNPTWSIGVGKQRIDIRTKAGVIEIRSFEGGWVETQIKTYIMNRAPTVNDDITLKYAVSNEWLDTTTTKKYVCIDATAGAAQWLCYNVSRWKNWLEHD